jgi:hypothetical protein
LNLPESITQNRIAQYGAFAFGGWWAGSARLQIRVVDVAPAPVFAALGTLDERMLRLVEMRAGVAIL